MNFFFDACISWRLCNMIASLEEGRHRITHITKHETLIHLNNEYGNRAADVEWLGVLGREDAPWNVLSGDTRIIDTAHERAALIASGLTFFAFDDHFSNASAYDQAAKLIRAWPDIVRYARSSGGSIYRVNTGRRPGIDVVVGSADAGKPRRRGSP